MYADQQEIAYDLSSGSIFDDLEVLLTYISRARHYSTFNISKTVQDRHRRVVTMEC